MDWKNGAATIRACRRFSSRFVFPLRSQVIRVEAIVSGPRTPSKMHRYREQSIVPARLIRNTVTGIKSDAQNMARP